MEIKVVNSKGEEEKPTEMKEATTEPVQTGEFEVQAVGQLFDLKPSEVSFFKDKIHTLLAYAKTQVENPTLENIKWAIRDLEFKVGTPPLGERMINYLTKYAYLKTEEINLKKEVKKYEHNI